MTIAIIISLAALLAVSEWRRRIARTDATTWHEAFRASRSDRAEAVADAAYFRELARLLQGRCIELETDKVLLTTEIDRLKVRLMVADEEAAGLRGEAEDATATPMPFVTLKSTPPLPFARVEE